MVFLLRGVLKVNSSEFDSAWRSLNKIALQPVPQEWTNEARPAFSEVMRHFAAATEPRVINLQNFSPGDLELLAGKQISLAHLLRNLKKTINSRYYDPREFQSFALRTGAVYAICPFTGKSLTSRQSFLANINVVFYRFVSERVFYVVTAGLGGGFQKSALYFPDFELIATAGDEWGLQKEDLIELKARMVCNFENCHRYLSNVSLRAPKTAICIGFYHFAHHLWNELSGIQRLCKAGELSKAGAVFVLREPLGKIDDLFPEIAKSKLERFPDTHAMFNKILEGGYLAVRVGDDFIDRHLLRRVHSVARSNTPSYLADWISHVRNEHFPLLWIGVRVGNRAWSDQVRGLYRLIRSLYVEFPKLGVVFDGFSLPADRLNLTDSDKEARRLVDQEKAEVAEIVRVIEQDPLLRGIGIFDIVGCSILEAISWAQAIDFYISPYGSLQHKVAWFAQKPGVVHSNKTILNDPARYVSSAVENPIQPRYLSITDVSDVRPDTDAEVRYNEIDDANESGSGISTLNKQRRGNPEFNNYVINSEALCNTVESVLESSKTLHPQVPAVVFASKRNLKAIMRMVTSFSDTSYL
jgi:hypothetical protein